MSLIALSFGFLGNLHEKELQKVAYLFQMLAWSSLFLVSNGSGKRWWCPLLQENSKCILTENRPWERCQPRWAGWQRVMSCPQT